MPLAIETVTDMKPEEARNHAKFTPTLNYTPTQRNTSALHTNTTQKNSHQHNTTKKSRQKKKLVKSNKSIFFP